MYYVLWELIQTNPYVPKKVKNVITIPKPSHEWDKQDKRKHN